jgi:hypothetical protein
MKTETVIKKNKWFKESCLIEDEKQVYCRLYKQDFNSDEEADAAADLIATALNACKEINKDNPLNVAKAIPELFKALITIAECENAGLIFTASDAKGFIRIAKNAIKKITEQ